MRKPNTPAEETSINTDVKLEDSFRKSVALFYKSGVTEPDRILGINLLVQGYHDLPLGKVANILNEFKPQKEVYASIH